MSNFKDNTEYILGGFVWGSAEAYWDKIIKQLSENYQLISIKKYKFSSTTDLERMITKLYENDRVSMNKIKNVKIRLLKKYKPVCLNFFFKVNNPTFEVDNRGILVIPDVIKTKMEIRNRFKHRIDGYRHDIIIHISDNSDQNQFIHNLINKYIKKKRQSNQSNSDDDN